MSTSAILQTRLRPPRLPAGHLVRGGLLDQVLGGLEGRLVLVVAGPGYGKTTLLAQAVEAADDPSVWLTLDDRLTDPGLIVAHLVAGLGERFPGVGAGLDLVGPPEAQLASLVNEIAATIADELILVIDDVHQMADGPAAGVVAQLLTDLPPNVHLALVGRRAPEFPRARLLPAGDLLEIGEETLAFTAAESAALLAGTGLVLSPEEISDLCRRTEGWPAGLLIAARAGGGPGEQLHAHASAQLFDYFAEEVFERQPNEIQEFLLATALSARFDAELARVLSGSDRASAIIARLLEEHLFVTRLAGVGDWYRYHPLLREYLLERLEALEPEEVAARHIQSGRFWEARGDIAEAVTDYFAAPVVPAFSALLVRADGPV